MRVRADTSEVGGHKEEMGEAETNDRKRPLLLWGQILGLLEQVLEDRLHVIKFAEMTEVGKEGRSG